MAKIEKTPENIKAGVAIPTNQSTTLKVISPAIEILIGGPYRGRDGEIHSYGHAALRVITSVDERVYDFGRYGAITGDFGAEGEGILRVWERFDTYITGENSYGRLTKGYTYLVPVDKANSVNKYFLDIVSKGTTRRAKHPNLKEFKLPQPYHALTNNCATVTLSGAKIALPGIDANGASHIQGRGMSSTEIFAARAKNFGSWPLQIFMPADVQSMLEENRKNIPRKITTYGKQ